MSSVVNVYSFKTKTVWDVCRCLDKTVVARLSTHSSPDAAIEEARRLIRSEYPDIDFSSANNDHMLMNETLKEQSKHEFHVVEWNKQIFSSDMDHIQLGNEYGLQ